MINNIVKRIEPVFDRSASCINMLLPFFLYNEYVIKCSLIKALVERR